MGQLQLKLIEAPADKVTLGTDLADEMNEVVILNLTIHRMNLTKLT